MGSKSILFNEFWVRSGWSDAVRCGRIATNINGARAHLTQLTLAIRQYNGIFPTIFYRILRNINFECRRHKVLMMYEQKKIYGADLDLDNGKFVNFAICGTSTQRLPAVQTADNRNDVRNEFRPYWGKTTMICHIFWTNKRQKKNPISFPYATLFCVSSGNFSVT